MLNEEEYGRLGLTSLQGQVVETLMELGGEASAPDIIKKLSESHKVNRTSIYSVLKKLEFLELVISKEGKRGANYSLITTSPSLLVSKLLEPQAPVVEKFEKQLRQAKDRQAPKIEHEIYYLQSKDQIKKQVEVVVSQSDRYLLLMATATMLDDIYHIVEEKVQSADTAILVIPTWNPDPDLDFTQIIQRYRRLLNAHQVSDPLPIFERLVPILQRVTGNLPTEIKDHMAETYFILAMNENDLLMANYLGELTGSGFYSREPMISQIMHIIYLSLFEQNSTIEEKVLRQISDIVLQTKSEQGLKSLLSLFQD
ncbi:MAG: hypothetical protein ACXAE3_09090 [Candidatus Kariarchaeaceae archaeon]|jgi:sugar-specific transcriptional regulator TrmB